jgi:hypothetical protein
MAEQSPASSGGAKRPWQGTTLGVLDIIGAVFLFLGAIMFFFMKSFLTDFLGSGTAHYFPRTPGLSVHRARTLPARQRKVSVDRRIYAG